MASGQIEMAALGRPFALGMLYDACKEELGVGLTLWNEETIQHFKKDPIPFKKTQFGLAKSDTTDSCDALVDVNESLEVGVLCGLIDIKQSVKFLINAKKSKSHDRILLRYTSTTTMEQLSLSHDAAESLSIQNLFEKTQATHVVTGILKGANAFFVFDTENTEENQFRRFEADIAAAINQISSENVGGGGGIKLDENVKAITDKLSCEFHGDFILQKNPKNFEDAINTYSELSKLLGENGENTVPVKVWLTPLKSLTPNAAELKRDISHVLLRRVKITLERLTDIETRCDTALGEEVSKIRQIEKKLKRFKKLCADNREMLQKTMRDKIPRVRRGLEEEISMKNILDDQEKSPFKTKSLEKWMKDAEDEIEAIKKCVIDLKQATIVQNETELKSKASEAPNKHSLCFVFTSLNSEDPYLNQMEKYLSGDETQTADQVPPNSEDQWFHSADVCKMMEKKASKMLKRPKFHIFSTKYNYFIAALPNPKYKGATIYHYKRGKRKTEDFLLQPHNN